MRTMTIAQLRKKSAIDLAKRKVSRPSAEEIAKATSVMNSYYRLCGLDERHLYLENDERMLDLMSIPQHLSILDTFLPSARKGQRESCI